MVQIRIATGVTRGFERLPYCDVESEWKNQYIIFPKQRQMQDTNDVTDQQHI
jgi:hypothetical protein